MDAKDGDGTLTPEQTKQFDCLISKLCDLLRKKAPVILKEMILQEEDLPSIPEPQGLEEVDVQITTAIPKKEHAKEFLQLANTCYTRIIDTVRGLSSVP